MMILWTNGPLIKRQTDVGVRFRLYRDNRAGFAWLFNGRTFWTFDDRGRRGQGVVAGRGG